MIGEWCTGALELVLLFLKQKWSLRAFIKQLWLMTSYKLWHTASSHSTQAPKLSKHWMSSLFRFVLYWFNCFVVVHWLLVCRRVILTQWQLGRYDRFKWFQISIIVRQNGGWEKRDLKGIFLEPFNTRDVAGDAVYVTVHAINVDQPILM